MSTTFFFLLLSVTQKDDIVKIFVDLKEKKC